MKPVRFTALLLAALQAAALAFAADPAAALPFVGPMFADHMVLQRDRPNTIWGWAAPGTAVRVEIAGNSATAIAGADGRWQARVEPPATGGPYTLTIDGPRRVTLRDVLVGDVWLCGGQSNMFLGLGASENGAAEIAAADHPQIRLFLVPQAVGYAPKALTNATWKVCSPATVAEGGWGGFSAVAYFFARKLQEQLGVPVGLVESCVGGSPAESWMRPAAVRAVGGFDEPLDEIEALRTAGAPEYGSFVMHWYDRYDTGLKGATWADPKFDDSAWKPVRLPGGFAELGVADVPAVAWFRREIVLPDPLPAGAAKIFLGVVEKMDTVWINGRWTGASSWVENPRVYPIGPDVLVPGRNSVVVRVLKLRPDGGFRDPAETLCIELGDGTKIPLAGAWRGASSVDARPPHPLPLTYENYPTMPTVLFQGMLAPVAPLAIRGAIWYQGEANFLRARQYRTLLPALIADWRDAFGQGEFPFYIAGLPAFMARRDAPGDDAWAELREAQALTAHNVRNTGLAITVDTGDATDIHPKQKRVVGERLALCALAQEFGQAVVSSGPTLRAVERLPGALRLRFDHLDGGLVVRGDKPAEFSVAGADRQWHWAEARIVGDAVILSSPDVPEPVAARYAWQANPAATLFNGAGLPAAPFRTDDWPGSTDNARPW